MFKIPEFPLMILQRLEQSGCEAFIVGGAVRDLCLKRMVVDWDITTSATQDMIKAIFADLKSFSLKHETVTLIHAGLHFEITPFRGPASLARSIKQDLSARDFTINAMAYDIRRDLILDPYQGRSDLVKKTIKAVKNPNDRFAEDPLRILRAIRLATELGFSIEPVTRDAMAIMADQLKKVARERIRVELMKILIAPKPSQAFTWMVKINLLTYILPELYEGYRMRQSTRYHQYTIYRHILKTVDHIRPDPILRLAALLHDIAKPRVRQKIKGQYRFIGHEIASADLAKIIMERLGFSKAEIEEVYTLIIHHMIDYHSEWSDGAIRKLLHRVGLEHMDSLMILRRADVLAHGCPDDQLDLLSELEKRISDLHEKVLITKMEELDLNGHEVMQVLNLPPGPRIGQILEFLLAEVLENPNLNTKENLIRILEKMKAP